MLKVSAMELSIVKNSMLRKSYKEMAELIDRPVEEISSIVADLISTMDIQLVTWQRKIDEKKISKLKEALKPKKVFLHKPDPVKKIADEKLLARRKEDKKRVDMEKTRIRERGARESRQKFATIDVDYTKCKMIRIDRTTIIYAAPGEDPAKKKADFLKNYKKPLDKII